MTDGELVAAIARGEIGALRSLHERHAPWLGARLSHRCSDPHLVEEAVQDTFVMVWRKAGSYRGEGEVGAWLWGIAIRRLLDLLRKGRVPRLPRTAAVESAEETVLEGIGYGDLGRAMGRLSPELLAVVQARILESQRERDPPAGPRWVGPCLDVLPQSVGVAQMRPNRVAARE